MRTPSLLLLGLVALAGPLQAQAPTPDPLLSLADRYRVGLIRARAYPPEVLAEALAPAVAAGAFAVRELGRSAEGRPIRSYTFGNGPSTVLLWSQMHGDETTATMALADMMAWLADSTPDPRRGRWREQLTVVLVPMLNPDGAERFRRENAWGIDVNRDARSLATPEGRILAGLRDSLRPDFAFNLHDQGTRSRVGPRGLPSAFALLAPAADEPRTWTPSRQRARRLAAAMAVALGRHVPGRVARYDDTWSARAFGDAMQTSGASTVLLETGVFPGDPEKQQLRRYNVVALVTALDAIAADAEVPGPTAPYDDLPENASSGYDLLVRNGEVELPGLGRIRADLGFRMTGGVGATGLLLEDVGDLRDFTAVDTLDATGLVLHPGPAMRERLPRLGLQLGAPADLEGRDAAGVVRVRVDALGARREGASR